MPHTRSMADMAEVLDVLAADDPDTRGDLWRRQPWVAIRPPRRFVPTAIAGASVRFAASGWSCRHLRERRPPGRHGGNRHRRPDRAADRDRPSVMALWQAARARLEAAGAEVVLTDFPLVSNYEGDRAGAPTIATRALFRPDICGTRSWTFAFWAWDDFLSANADPGLNGWRRWMGRWSFPVLPAPCPPTVTPTSKMTSRITPPMQGCICRRPARHSGPRGGPPRA